MPGPHPIPIDLMSRRPASADRFRKLHEAFLVMANPWDVGSAKLLAAFGFDALATSSAAHAWSLGKPDGALTREEAIAHAAAIGAATGLPVNGDFEQGYGDLPDAVAETIAMAIEADVAGASIEDLSPGGPDRLFPEAMAAHRLEAAREAIERSRSRFVLTGRCEALLAGVPDAIAVVERRFKAYRAAGADVLYAPGLTKQGEVERALAAADGVPVNVIAGLGGISDDLAALQRLGVRRISLGSNLAKVALGAFERAVEALAAGRFERLPTMTSAAVNAAMGRLP